MSARTSPTRAATRGEGENYGERREVYHERPLDALLGRLEGVKQTGADRWTARCPAHADRSPSLSIQELDDGRLLIHCFAACEPADVMGAVGLELKDLFPQRTRTPDAQGHRARPSAGKVIEAARHELQIVVIAIDDLLAGRLPEGADYERLRIAADRLRACAHGLGVRP